MKIKLFILFIVALIPYLQTFNDPFHFDDYTLLNMNYVVSPGKVDTWLTSRIVGYITFALNFAAHELKVEGYHVVNWAIHLASGIVVWQVARQVLVLPRVKNEKTVKYREEISLLAACLFLSHPLQTQAVTYIVQRLASLATLFYLVAIWGWLTRRWVVLVIASVLALFTKETSLTLPLMFIWLWWWSGAPVISKKVVLGIMGGVVVLLGVFLLKAVPINYIFFPKITNINETVTWQTYAITEVRVWVTYLRLLAFPIHQNLDYYYPISTSLYDWRVLGSGVILTGLGYSLWHIRKKAPMVVLGFGWWVIALIIESSFMPIADVIFEHRLYLPMVGMAIAVASGLFALLASRPGDAKILGSILVLVLMVLTFRRNGVWASEYTLWRDVAAKSPLVGRVHNLYGVQLYLGKAYSDAFYQFQEATRLNPDIDGAYANAGHALMNLGKYEEAIIWYTRSLEVNPNIAMDVPKYIAQAKAAIKAASESAVQKK